MSFNRQVLEQVAKDGKTYVSLAKEMANYILAKPASTSGELPDSMQFAIAVNTDDAKRLNKAFPDTPVFTFTSFGERYTFERWRPE